MLGRFAYNMVLQKQGKLLYDNVQKQVAAHLKTVAAKVKQQTDATLLKVLSESWEQHNKTMRMISDILMYMVSTACTSAAGTGADGC